MSNAPQAVPTATAMDEFCESIAANGFCLYPDVVGSKNIEELIGAFEKAKDSPHARAHDGDTYALRNVLKAIPEVYAVGTSDELLTIVKAVLGENTKPIKAILFDKTEGVNWSLRWHQDNVISVDKRPQDVEKFPGFEAWSEKVGVPHVRPPVEILENILAARIHIDDCPVDNGALEVIPGSHAHGRLSDEELNVWKTSGKKVVCPARKGDVLFMRPLLLHRSGKSQKPLHRRVLHIEYTAIDLPGGLAWGV